MAGARLPRKQQHTMSAEECTANNPESHRNQNSIISAATEIVPPHHHYDCVEVPRGIIMVEEEERGREGGVVLRQGWILG